MIQQAAAPTLARVAEVTGVPIEVITGPRKTRVVSWARYLAIAELRRRFAWWTQSNLAEAVGATHHGTVIHALRRIEQLEETEPDFARMKAMIMSPPPPVDPSDTSIPCKQS